MQLGIDFFCLDSFTGERLPALRWPKIESFRYPDNGSRGFWLLQDFSVVLCFRGKWTRLTVLHGFDFDGASIPRWAWSIIGDPLALDIQIAALFHDLLYCAHLPDWPKALADSLFLEIQQACAGSWMKRKITTTIVKSLGWTAWPKTEDEIAKYRLLCYSIPVV